MHETLLTGDEVFRSKPENTDGVNYARIPARHTSDYFFKGENYTEPSSYSSENATQLSPEDVLSKLREAKIL